MEETLVVFERYGVTPFSGVQTGFEGNIPLIIGRVYSSGVNITSPSRGWKGWF